MKRNHIIPRILAVTGYTSETLSGMDNRTLNALYDATADLRKQHSADVNKVRDREIRRAARLRAEFDERRRQKFLTEQWLDKRVGQKLEPIVAHHTPRTIATRFERELAKRKQQLRNTSIKSHEGQSLVIEIRAMQQSIVELKGGSK